MCRDAGSAADSSARNLGSRRSGGLRGEIIRPSVDDHDAPNNFADPKAVGKNGQVGVSVISKQRRQVAGVTGMREVPGIVVPPGARKRIFGVSFAAAPLMDVKGKDFRF